MALTKITPQMFDTSATAHDLNVDNGTFVVDGSASRVGIGTATPSTLLDVNGTATATTFVGALTGNVTGNVSGTAATVTGAAQTNITSLGTLSALTVTGTSTLGVVDASSFTDVITNTIYTQSSNLDIDVVLSGRDVTFTQGSTALMTVKGDATGTTVAGNLTVTGQGDFSTQIMVGTNNTTLSENNFMFNPAGHFYIDHMTTGQNIFFRTSNSSSRDTTAMTITAAGLVGIGKTPAFASLEIEGDKTLANNLQLQINGATNTNKQLILGYDTSTDEAHIISQLAGSALKPLIVSASAVGIGTSTMTPTSALHVDKSHTGTLVTFHQTAGNSSADRGLDVETSSTGTTVQRWLNSGAELARISGTGIFSLYSQRLEISNSGDTKATFIRSNNTVSLAMATTASGGYGFYDNSRGGYDLYLKNNAVGIGTSAPAAQLEISATSSGHNSTSNIFRITAPTYPMMEFYSTNTNTNNKNWKIASVYNSYGTLEFLRSSAANGVPNVTTLAMNGVGNVGIGTHVPGARLDIETAGNTADGTYYSTITINNTGSSTYSRLRFDRSASARWGVGLRSDDKFQIARLFNTASDDTFVIDSGGNILIATADNAPYNNNADSTADNGIVLSSAGWISNARHQGTVLYLNRTGNNGQILAFNRSGATKGEVAITTTSVQYYTTSDARLKDNIVDAPSASEDIDSIQVRSFDWKEDDSHQKYGMIAQELLPVAPDAVSQPEDSEEMMSIDYSKLVPMLVKEIQSLRARVTQLEEEK